MLQMATSYYHQTWNCFVRSAAIVSSPSSALQSSVRIGSRLRDFSNEAIEINKFTSMPSTCTADELHYVSVSKPKWKLALWRYIPLPDAPRRDHPLLLLSGVGTNAIGYDLSPGSSFARYMSSQGFDTWILEFRGAGLSERAVETTEVELSPKAISEKVEASAGSSSDEVIFDDQKSSYASSAMIKTDIPATGRDITTTLNESALVAKLTGTFMGLSEYFSSFLTERQLKITSGMLFDQISKLLEDSQLFGRFNELRARILKLLESKQNTTVSSQIKDLSQRLVSVIEDSQRSMPSQFFDLTESFSSTIEDFQKQLELIVKFDWDFDHYLEEDIPAAMEYVRFQSKPKDGRLCAIGHSMGGILLYAMLSKYAFEGKEPGLAAVVTLGSSLDYTSSKSSLKLLLPLADPAQALNVPAIPLGAMLASAYPLASSPPYVLSWLNPLISAEGMMHPELFKRLVLNNFCTIPAKLILQLTTAFKEGGLSNRNNTFFYKDHIHKITVPVLALAGDEDLICPPDAVFETVKLIPEHLVTYKIFGGSGHSHYGHYDLVGGRLAPEEVYPCIVQFLSSWRRSESLNSGSRTVV